MSLEAVTEGFIHGLVVSAIVVIVSALMKSKR